MNKSCRQAIPMEFKGTRKKEPIGFFRRRNSASFRDGTRHSVNKPHRLPAYEEPFLQLIYVLSA
jgi:hypothetical protein